MRVIALVDGEHYPAVTQWGVATAWSAGYEVMTALAVGGVEKLDASRRLLLDNVDVIHPGGDPLASLVRAIDLHSPEAVLDLSDEPILEYGRRMEFVSMSLTKGVSYIGPGFRFDPPVTGSPLPVATLGVIGTGKRTGKTAVSAHAARLSAASGEKPVVVAVGRGGPPGPASAGPEDVSLEALSSRADRGEHAASDFLEDALVAGVRTVGARRCGGGLAGMPFASNVAEAAGRAVELGGNPVILEGSGASVPSVPWDAGILVAASSTPASHLAGYLGPFRVLLSDLAIFTMMSGPTDGSEHLSVLESHVRRLRADIKVAVVELQPVPLADVRGKTALFATTAHPLVAGRLARELERVAGCRVVKVSARLGDRAGLERDLSTAPSYDVLLTELKAAAVDVAARRASERGAEVVFVDNRPRSVGGDGEVDDLLREVTVLAKKRAASRLDER